MDKLYELKFEERPEYLLAEVTSETMNAEIARHYLTRIAEKCRDIDADHVMIIRNVPVMLADGDLFDTTNFFRELMRGIRVSFVNPHTAIEDDMEFAIRIGTNRGALYSLCNTIEEAEKWLLQSPRSKNEFV